MEGRKMWLERVGQHSPLTRMRHSMCASRTSSKAVCDTSTARDCNQWLTQAILDAYGGSLSRHVELDIDIGADAKDWSAIQAGERLKPTEAELRRIEEVVGEVVKEMDYLREREQKLRDTNESTNDRVKWFALGTMATLTALGAWQVVYLRAYFRFVRHSSLRHPEYHANDYMQVQASYLALSTFESQLFKSSVDAARAASASCSSENARPRLLPDTTHA